MTVRGTLREDHGRLVLEDGDGHRVLAMCRQPPPKGAIEATGELWDVGRMKPDDERLTGLEPSAIGKVDGGGWPRPGDVFVFAVSRFAAIHPTPVTTIRSIVLEGRSAAGRFVTVSGQFRGRNLFGDLPKSPGKSAWDFVLRASNAAIWVSGLEPKGKDFLLNPSRRVDTDRWLSVSGIVREGHGLMWIEAKSVALAEPDSTTTAAPARSAVPPPASPPPEVLFSVPVDGETDVAPSVAVRIQFSRDLAQELLKGRVLASYVATDAVALPLTPALQIVYDEHERVLTLRFAQPLEAWRTVQVDLLDGIKGTDGQALKPWRVTFTLGGR